MTAQARTSAGSVGSSLMDEARDVTRRVAEQAKTNPTPRGAVGAVEKLPATVYLWAMLGSVGGSVLLRLAGKPVTASVVRFCSLAVVALALMNKQLRPPVPRRTLGLTWRDKRYLTRAARALRDDLLRR